MSLALQIFLDQHDLLSITQRFCEPGHSSIQEIDAVHSVIERYIKPYQVYSPVSLIRHFKNIKPLGQSMEIIQVKKNLIHNYSEKAKLYNYSLVKFSKAKQLRYEKANLGQISVCYNFSSQFERHQVIRPTSQRGGRSGVIVPTVKLLNKQTKLSEEKVKDLKSMMVFIDPDDRRYFETLLR